MNGLPQLFERAVSAATSSPGWCDATKAATLASLVVAYKPNLVVEVGVYGGSSLFPMAIAVKETGQGKVIGIDPWDKAIAVNNQTTNEDREWWMNQDYEKLYSDVLRGIDERGLRDYCSIIRKPSDHVDPPFGIGIFHCDGSHNDQAIRDVVRYAPRVEIGGFCVTDDSDWKGGAVARAEQRLLQLGFKRLYQLGTGAVFQRVR